MAPLSPCRPSMALTPPPWCVETQLTPTGVPSRLLLQIEQKFFPLDDTEKDQRLWKILEELPDNSKVVTFANTKRRVDHLARECWNAGFGACATCRMGDVLVSAYRLRLLQHASSAVCPND